MKYFPLSLILLLFLSVAACKKDKIEPVNKKDVVTTPKPDVDSLKMNEIQIIGSHNSYRLKTYEPIFQFLQDNKALIGSSNNPDELDYTHLPLPEQFNDYGIRKIELDIYYDPNGGLFYNREGNKFVSEPVASGIPELQQPGMKIIHIPDVDYETNYLTCKQALQTVKEWSEQHPRHLPLYILVETKETSLAGMVPIPGFNFAAVKPFDATALDAIDQEIRDIFGANLEGVLTPDEVRGEYATLNEAILKGGWPILKHARGKVVFIMNNDGTHRDIYIQGHASLKGRIMFTNETPGTAEAAFVMINDPHTENISNLVEQGYIIRTRSDAGTHQAREGDYSDMEAAFASGAQIISTDYYRPDPRHTTDPGWTDYTVSIPGGGIARLNPVNGPAKYKDVAITE